MKYSEDEQRTINKVRWWLMRALEVDKRINILLKKHYEAYCRATSVTSQLSGMPGGGSKDPHKMDAYLSQLDYEMGDELMRLSKAKCEALAAIDKVQDAEVHSMLTRLYIPNERGETETIDDLAKAYHYDRSTIYRKLNPAYLYIATVCNIE